MEEIAKQEELDNRESSAPAKASILIGTILGASMFTLFWKHWLGINIFFFVLVLVLLAQFSKYLIKRKFYLSKWDLFFLPILIIASGFIFNSSPSMRMISAFVFVAILPVLTYLSIYPETISRFSFLNSIALYIQQMISPWASIPAFLKSVFRVRVKTGKIITPSSIKIMLGLIITLPVVCVLTIFLSRADEVFNKLITTIVDLVNKFIKDILQFENLWDVFMLLLFIIFSIFISLGYVFARFKVTISDFLYEQRERGIDLTIANVLVGGINFVFTVFVIIQFRYLFFGGDRIAELGYTYSQYARHGFGELQLVAIFVLAILYTLIRYGQKESQIIQNITKGNLIVVLLNTLVIVFSGMFRMHLYFEAYGYTLLRFYSYAFMLFQLLLFAYLIPSVIFRGIFKQFSLFIISIGLTFLCIFSILSPERIITKLNIARAAEAEYLDLNYTITLSFDAINELDIKNFNEITPLKCQIFSRYHEQLHDHQWQSWSLSKSKFQSKLAEANLTDDKYLSDCDVMIRSMVKTINEEYNKEILNGNYESARVNFWVDNSESLVPKIDTSKFRIVSITNENMNDDYKNSYFYSGNLSDLYPKFDFIEQEVEIEFSNGKVKCYRDNLAFVLQNGELKIYRSELFPLASQNVSFNEYYYDSGMSENSISNLNQNTVPEYLKCN